MLGQSTWVGKEAVKKFLKNYLRPGMKICDMGAGKGIYRDILGDKYEWTAVEIWPESIMHLKTFYNFVYGMNLIDFSYQQDYDLVIFGDVIEHLTVEDAQYAIQQAEAHSKAILISVPYCYEQGAIDGNEAEIHRQADLTPELFDQRYPGFETIFKTDYLAYYWKQM